jgi:Predicted membrane protein (DUF2254)
VCAGANVFSRTGCEAINWHVLGHLSPSKVLSKLAAKARILQWSCRLNAPSCYWLPAIRLQQHAWTRRPERQRYVRANRTISPRALHEVGIGVRRPRRPSSLPTLLQTWTVCADGRATRMCLAAQPDPRSRSIDRAKQIVEIAIRALSPAVSDTFTGVGCVDWAVREAAWTKILVKLDRDDIEAAWRKIRRGEEAP